MASTFGDKLKHAWNAFSEKEDYRSRANDYGASYGLRPDRVRLSVSNERSIISSVYTRLGIDVAALSVRHVRLDENRRYVEDIHSSLNACFTIEANVDQAARAFRQDVVMTMFDKGVVAIVPVDTSLNPSGSGGFDIRTIRAGEITGWYPRHVRVNLYNDRLGRKQELMLPKSTVAIIENPLYAVMNEPNSTLQRLIAKLNMLDAVDKQSSSGKLDIIIKLPYVIKSEARRKEAEERRKAIEVQLQGSKYGVAYVDGTEDITQLNRPSENNLLKQVEYLTTMLYGQLGLTESIFDGTATEATMINYHNRTIEPVIVAIVESMRRVFLTKTARSQLQSIEYFKDAFKLVPVSDLAEIADKFTRNEVMSSNEVRAIIGLTPVKDPKAEELRNKNLPEVVTPPPQPKQPAPANRKGELQNGST